VRLCRIKERCLQTDLKCVNGWSSSTDRQFRTDYLKIDALSCIHSFRKLSTGQICAATSGVHVYGASANAAAAASTVRQAQTAAAARWRNTTPLPAPPQLYGHASMPSFHFCYASYLQIDLLLITCHSIKYKMLWAIAERPHCRVRYSQGHREFPFWNWKIPPAQRKIPENSRCLSLLLNYHSLCNTSTLYMACIPYVVFMGRDVGYCVLSVLPLFSLMLILTVNLWSYLCVCTVHRDDQCMVVTVTRIWLDEPNCRENNGWWMSTLTDCCLKLLLDYY